MLLYIITNAVLFSFLMTHEQIPQAMAAWIIDKNFSVWMFLLVVNVILLLAGNVMDPSSILLIMAPILYPLATKLGVNPVHLGVLMIVNTEVGLCHPPVGLNLYIASSIAKMGISEITIAVLPWLCRDAGLPRLDHLPPGNFAMAAAARCKDRRSKMHKKHASKRKSRQRKLAQPPFRSTTGPSQRSHPHRKVCQHPDIDVVPAIPADEKDISRKQRRNQYSPLPVEIRCDHIIEAGRRRSIAHMTNGPFMLKEFTPNDRLVLVKNPYYYDAAHVALDEEIFYSLEDRSAALRRFMAGEI